MPNTTEKHKQAAPNTVVNLRDSVLSDLAKHPFRPPRVLRNPHLQTVGARYIRRLPTPATHLERWETADNDFVRVHIVDGDPDAPIAVLSHGLEGSVESTYLVGLIQELQRVEWNVVAFEHRSCGGEMNRARRMYHSGDTDDLSMVVERTIARYPGKPVFVAGYSLGGNQLAKWFGEMGNAIPDAVRGAAVVSAPFDLVESQKFLDTGIRRGYVLHFLRKLVPKAIEKDRLHPGLLDIERIKRTRSFREFDDLATAPLHGFEDGLDYYTRVACGQFLHGIRRPTMILSSADDPFNPGHTIPHHIIDDNPHIVPQITDFGGHVGFIRSEANARVGYWAEEQIVRFFQAIHARD